MYEYELKQLKKQSIENTRHIKEILNTTREATAFREYNTTQCEAFNKWIDDYLWFKGIELCHDPLCDKCRRDWIHDFIRSETFMKCAKQFRKEWEEQHA